VLDARSWSALRCFAGDSRVAPILDEHRPAEPTLDCGLAKVHWQ
jgi:hypothetical protein